MGAALGTERHYGLTHVGWIHRGLIAGGVVPYAHYKSGFLPPCVNLNNILNQNHQKRLSGITLIFLHFRQTLNHTSMSIVIKFPSVTGIHKTLVSSHKDVVLAVEMDNLILHIDPECMRVMFPTTVPSSLMGEVTWPKNPKRKRYTDQIVRLLRQTSL